MQHRQLFLDTARILIREKPYSAAHGALDSWESHARLVVSALSISDLESGSFLQDLFPNLSTSDRDAVLTLTTAMSRVKTQGGLLEPADTSAPTALPAGSRGERIYLFANCWNDAGILPFFFRHYDSLVERYVIYDDGSTDGSLDLLAAHPRVDVRRFVWTHPDSFVLSELDHYNEIWKECRGTADWVLLVDLDEHLHATDFGGLLKAYRSQGISVVPAFGFEMVTDDFPSPAETLVQTRRLGVPSPAMSKLTAFDPCAVDQLNHAPGGHSSEPTGRLVAPPRDSVRLLHYKNSGTRLSPQARWRSSRAPRPARSRAGMGQALGGNPGRGIGDPSTLSLRSDRRYRRDSRREDGAGLGKAAALGGPRTSW